MPKRLYIRDLKALCDRHGVSFEQDEQLRTFTFYGESGHYVLAINPKTKQAIFRLNELTLTEWEVLVSDAKEVIEKSANDHLMSIFDRM